MSMTRRDYVQMAAAIRKEVGNCDDGAAERIATELAWYFKQDNSAFRYSQWFDACGMQTPARFLGAR